MSSSACCTGVEATDTPSRALVLFWETARRVFMVQPGLINSPETHNNDSVVAQACCVPAGHLTLYQLVAAGLGPDHGERESETTNVIGRVHAGPASLVRVSGGNLLEGVQRVTLNLSQGLHTLW